jgi:hypothetical protein
MVLFSIPFWCVLLIILAAGVTVACLVIHFFDQGSYDFVTPIIAGIIFLITIFLVIGLALGKYVF